MDGIAFQAFAQGQNKVLLRLENLLDNFDKQTSGTKFVNVFELAKDIWLEANQYQVKDNKSLAQAPEPKITEMNLVGTQTLSEMQSQKAQFEGKSALVQKFKEANDVYGYKGVALDSMSIRTFLIEF